MYEPSVDDYVIWKTKDGMTHEGWVYFKGDITPPKKGFPDTPRYITIELGTKDKPNCQYTSGKIHRHRKIHILLLCYEAEWKNLQYVKNRKEELNVSMYHSQQGRYEDTQ